MFTLEELKGLKEHLESSDMVVINGCQVYSQLPDQVYRKVCIELEKLQNHAAENEHETQCWNCGNTEYRQAYAACSYCQAA